MAGWITLVQAETLADALGGDDLALIDCRFSLADTAAGEAAFRQSHLPGAVYAHLDRDLSGEHKAGTGRHPWPDAADFTARLGEWGIDRQHQVVAYDDGSGAIAARLWCLLRMLGHDNVAVLDGGWMRWTALGLPIEREVRIPTKTRYVAGFDKACYDHARSDKTRSDKVRFDRSRLLDAGQVQAHLDNGGLLLDARAADRFRGENETLDPVAGHIPDAHNRPFADNLVDGRFKSAQQLAEEFRNELAGRDPSELVAMCGSGVTACHHLLALEHAGLHGARLYTGSWSGWIEDPSRPVAR